MFIKYIAGPKSGRPCKTEDRIGKKNYLDKLEKQVKISQLKFHKTGTKYCTGKGKKLNA